MLRNGQPIETYPLSEQVDTGISYSSLLPNMVSEYEEREACKENNFNWLEWQTLDWEEKSRVVAFYRLHILIELHRNEALSQEMKHKRTEDGT